MGVERVMEMYIMLLHPHSSCFTLLHVSMSRCIISMRVYHTCVTCVDEPYTACAGVSHVGYVWAIMSNQW